MENVPMRHSAVAKRRRRRIKNCKWAPESIRASAKDRFSSFFRIICKPELSWSLFFCPLFNARACVRVFHFDNFPEWKGIVWLVSYSRSAPSVIYSGALVSVCFPPARIMMTANVCTHYFTRNIYCTGAPRPARVDEPSECPPLI